MLNFLPYIFKRALRHWQVLFTLSLGVLLATALLASGPLLIDTVIQFGLRSELVNSEPIVGNILISASSSTYSSEEFEAIDIEIENFLKASLGDFLEDSYVSIRSRWLFPWREQYIYPEERINFGFFESADERVILTEGTWMVAKYNDSGDDETMDYDGFSFDFLADGSVVATKNDDVVEGTWSVTTDSGQEKFILDFGETLPLNEFNDDWDIEDVLENRVEFHSISGGDGTLDVLVLEKETM